MTKGLFVVVVALLLANAVCGQTLGWTQLPNTHLSDSGTQVGNSSAICIDLLSDNVTPEPWRAVEGCSAVIASWSGGIFDVNRNRLIVWGGGHNAYYGNEVYSLNLGANPVTLTRLNNAANPSPLCTPAYADGTPSSRHTYGGISYMGTAEDKMFVFGGAFACGSGGGIQDTWTLDLSNIVNPTTAWVRKDPVTVVGTAPSTGICEASDYDPNTNSVLLYDLAFLYRYVRSTNTYTQLSPNTPGGCGGTAVIDPGRKLFFLFGGGKILKADISGADPNYTLTDISASVTTCGALKTGSDQAIVYDPVQKLLVGWTGGNSILLFNPDTNACTTVTYPGGPGVPQANGTFGRFRYSPTSNIFVLVNDWMQDAFTLRLTTDFQSRCSQSGIVRCIGFDSALEISGVFGNNTGVTTGDTAPVIDNGVFASGGGSVRFSVPASSSESPSGSYFANFSPDLLTQFDSCAIAPTSCEFYVQWRQRFSGPNGLIDTFNRIGGGGGGGWKQAIITGGDIAGSGCSSSFSTPCINSCVDIGVIVQNSSQNQLSQMYHSCGIKNSSYEGLYEPIGSPPTDFYLQNSPRSPQCLFTQHSFGQPVLPCFGYFPNEWMTFQVHIKIGTWYSNNGVYKHDSTIQMWGAREGQPSVLIQDYSPQPGSAGLTCQNTQVSEPACQTGYDLVRTSTPPNKYGKIWLTPFQTGRCTGDFPVANLARSAGVVTVRLGTGPATMGHLNNESGECFIVGDRVTITGTTLDGGTFNVTNLAIASLPNTTDFTFSQSGNTVALTANTGNTRNLALVYTQAFTWYDELIVSRNRIADPGAQTVNVSLSPGTIAFGNSAIGLASPSQTATLTNTGTSLLTITGISIVGTADFSQTNNCPASLAAGLNCAITMTFTPHTLLPVLATLTVSDNAANNPQTVALSGTGIGNVIGVGSISGRGVIKAGP